MTSRRSFLKQSSVTAMGLAVGVPRWDRRPTLGVPIEPAQLVHDSSVQSLALRAIDAAKAAGAVYADVRLTRTLTDSYTNSIANGEGEVLAVGVRALFNGYWGFAASPYWDAVEVVRIAQDAVAQAKTCALGAAPRTVEWQPIPVASGSWSTPVKYDPFTIPIEEKCDFSGSWTGLAPQFDRRVVAALDMSFIRQERAVATTDGAFFIQTTYESSGGLKFILRPNRGDLSRVGQVNGRKLEAAGAGWEHFLDAKLPDQFPALLAEAEEQLHGRPVKAGDIGRFDVVFDAATMASLVDRTIGVATQLDRALGFEANAAGTSYLGPDTQKFLGTPIASKVVNVMADRSMPRGLATVKWDDEGVVPTPFSLVKDGVLVDYQTTREQAGWLGSWYKSRAGSVASHGCAGADSALSVTMQRMPNLTLESGRENIGFEDLVAKMPRGIAVIGGTVGTNMAGSDGGIFSARSYREIVNGKLGAELQGVVPIFNSTALWKQVAAVGGVASAEQFPAYERKGQPGQLIGYTVRAVPAKAINVAFINNTRRPS